MKRGGNEQADEDEEEQLRRLCLEGRSTEHTLVALGCDRNHLHYLKHKFGLVGVAPAQRRSSTHFAFVPRHVGCVVAGAMDSRRRWPLAVSSSSVRSG